MYVQLLLLLVYIYICSVTPSLIKLNATNTVTELTAASDEDRRPIREIPPITGFIELYRNKNLSELIWRRKEMLHRIQAAVLDQHQPGGAMISKAIMTGQQHIAKMIDELSILKEWGFNNTHLPV